MALIKYIAAAEKEAKVLENQQVLITRLFAMAKQRLLVINQKSGTSGNKNESVSA